MFVSQSAMNSFLKYFPICISSSPALIQKSGFEEKVTNNITNILINTW